MNFQESKILLDKINRLFEGMKSSPDHVSAIERDLMRSYIRDLYEQFYVTENQPLATKKVQQDVSTQAKPVEKPVVVAKPVSPEPKLVATPVVETPKVVVPKVETPVVRQEKIVSVEEIIPKAKVETPVQPVYTAPEPPKVVAPVETPKPIEKVVTPPTTPKPTPVVTSPPSSPAVTQPVVKQPVVTPPVRTVVQETTPELDEESEALFESKKATELSEKLGRTPIMDLNRAFGLNDRMLYTNELFGGNNNVYRETMEVLNSFNSLDQAKVYIIENVAGRFDWTARDKKKLAKEFIKTVSRKYVR